MAQENNENKFSVEKYKSLENIVINNSVDSYRKKVKDAIDKLAPVLKDCKNACIRLQEAEKRSQEATALKQIKTEAESQVKPVPQKPAQPDQPKAETKSAESSQPVQPDQPVQPKKEQPQLRAKSFDTKPAAPSYVKGKAAVIYTDVKPKKYAPGQRPQGGKDYSQGGAGRDFKKPASRVTGTTEYASNIVNVTNTKRTKGDKKQDTSARSFEDKTPMTKRKLIRKGYITEDESEDRVRIRKLKGKKKEETPVEHKTIDHVVVTSERLTIKELSEKMGVGAQEILKTMLMMGGAPVASINDTVDRDTMIIVADAFHVNLEYKIAQSVEDKAEEMHEIEDNEADLVERPPVITVMGHVDHGKTSLLDAIRSTHVASGEAGGITQHIGAYSVSWDYDGRKRKITFLDTPGHEAFTQMRARGAKVTDIVILVVAADDGVQPQTIEAIDHVKAAKCPLIVAINKIDKVDANIEKIKEELAKYGVVTDEWGGDTKMVPISAKNRKGIDTLLEEILFLADCNNYRANPARKAKGAVIEARMDKGKGPVATILVQNGTLNKNDAVVCGKVFGKIRTMTDYSGKPVKSAGPSSAVLVTGLSDVPDAGDDMWVVEDERAAKEIVDGRIAKEQIKETGNMAIKTFEDGSKKTLNILIKADVKGSSEALKDTISKLENDEVKVSVVHTGVGIINKSDMMLAQVSNAMVIGFNVKPDADARQIAEQSGIKVGSYSIIYDALDAIEAEMTGMTEPKFHDVYTGKAEVRAIFKASKAGNIAGSYVLDGKITRNAKVIVKRGEKEIAQDTIAGLKRFKDDVKEVAYGFECGITLNSFDEFEEGDIIEAYVEERI